MNTTPEKSHRGFAAMDAAKQREIASKGGKASHREGHAHEFTPDEARAAGRKGGKAAHEKGTAHEFTPDEARAAGRKGGETVSRNRAHMAEIGRKGGEARSANRARRLQEAQAATAPLMLQQVAAGGGHEAETVGAGHESAGQAVG